MHYAETYLGLVAVVAVADRSANATLPHPLCHLICYTPTSFLEIEFLEIQAPIRTPSSHHFLQSITPYPHSTVLAPHPQLHLHTLAHHLRQLSTRSSISNVLLKLYFRSCDLARETRRYCNCIPKSIAFTDLNQRSAVRPTTILRFSKSCLIDEVNSQTFQIALEYPIDLSLQVGELLGPVQSPCKAKISPLASGTMGIMSTMRRRTPQR